MGYQTKIEMDGAVCIHTQDGDVIIKRKTARNWILLIILGMIKVLILAAFLSTLSRLVGGTATLVESIEAIAVWVGVGGLVALVMYVLIRALRQPPIHFKAGAGAVQVGRRGSSRAIPFSRIRDTVVESPSGDVVQSLVTFLTIGLSTNKGELDIKSVVVVLDDGERIGLGSVSGKKARERSIKIATQIRQVVKMSKISEIA